MPGFYRALSRVPRRERNEVRRILYEAKELVAKSRASGTSYSEKKQLNRAASSMVWDALSRIAKHQPPDA